LGRSSELKKLKNSEKVEKGPTDRLTNKVGCRVAEHATKKLCKNNIKNTDIVEKKKQKQTLNKKDHNLIRI